jgi:arsenite-transporting ATPase
MTDTIIITGAGGVGKTTLAAAIGVAIATTGARTLVLTIDPAMRLADALGIDDLGDDPRPVAGVTNLSAAMLDVSASWEAIIHRYAEPDVGDRLLVNPYFRAIADRFPAAQSYAAGERMAEFIETKLYDVIVVDTPPSGGGIDFFRAPARTGDLVSGKLLKWLTGSRLPGRGLIYQLAARPMLRLADTVLGGAMLSDVAAFLVDLRTMYDGLAARSRTIERYLRSAHVVIATTADPTPLHETHRFFRELGEFAITPDGIVFNRTLPAEWIEDADRPLRRIEDPDFRATAKANLRTWASEARRQADAIEELSARYGIDVHTIRWRTPPPETLEDLHALVGGGSLLASLPHGSA